MAKKLSYSNLGMDVLERLYYDRQAMRKRAYYNRAKKKKTNLKKGSSSKKLQTKLDSDVFDETLKQAI